MSLSADSAAQRIVSVTFRCPNSHGRGPRDTPVEIHDHAVEGGAFAEQKCPLCGATMAEVKREIHAN